MSNRYDRYTRWIESPKPGLRESAEQVERGSRALHWEGMENGPDPLRAWDAIRWNAEDARVRRTGERPRTFDQIVADAVRSAREQQRVYGRNTEALESDSARSRARRDVANARARSRRRSR